MADQMIQENLYRTLVQDLESIRITALSHVAAETNTILVNSYWHMGKRLSHDRLIVEAGEKNVQRRLLGDLARDLALEYTFLSRVMKLYQLWPKGSPAKEAPQLTWSHYKILLGIGNTDERAFYFTGAVEDGWSCRELSQRIKDDQYKRQLVTHMMPVVGEEQQRPVLARREEALHVYAGVLEQIVDGDTLIVRIDLGFHVWFSERLRLRGIDTPELATPAGVAARDFVIAQLKGIERVVIQTFTVDLYGRYVCDVFYLPGMTETEVIFRHGQFLNQELLDAGHAVLM